ARPLTLVLSCSGQRQLATIAAPLLACARRVLVTRADPVRSADPQALVAALRPQCAEGVSVQLLDMPQQALARASAQTPVNGVICATGSVYMAGVARGYWR